MADPIDWAREAKARKRECLRSLTNGGRKVAEVIRRPPPPLQRCDLWTVLVNTYNMGAVGARKVCEDAGVWPYLELKDLTAAERKRIIEALPKRAQ